MTEGLLPESDPTAFQEVRAAGRGRRRMFDRRAGTFVTIDNVHLFKACEGKIFYMGNITFYNNLLPVTPTCVACRKTDSVTKL